MPCRGRRKSVRRRRRALRRTRAGSRRKAAGRSAPARAAPPGPTPISRRSSRGRRFCAQSVSCAPSQPEPAVEAQVEQAGRVAVDGAVPDPVTPGGCMASPRAAFPIASFGTALLCAAPSTGSVQAFQMEDNAARKQGIVVFDELEKSKSHLLIDPMHRCFAQTAAGRHRASRIIPEPFFVRTYYYVSTSNRCTRTKQGSSKVAVRRSCLAILALGAARVPRDRGRPALERGQDALDPGTPPPAAPRQCRL